MKKNFLLPLYLLCACGFSACSSINSKNQTSTFVSEEEAPIIDATTAPNNRCGVNGISCNDTALVNYTKTEADYRTYGERTKKDHLYTQSSAGNNLTATIQPDIENDIVMPTLTISDTVRKNQKPKYVVEDGVFSETGKLELETSRKSYEAPNYTLDEQHSTSKSAKSSNKTPPQIQETVSNKVEIPQNSGSTVQQSKVGHADNINLPEIKEIKQIKKSVAEDGSSYEIICEEDCEDIIDDDVITSEFTEDSFDIADYIDDENIEFTEIGSPNKIITDIDIKEIQVGDDTVLTWEAEEGENLRELLTKWSAMSGWKLLWNTNRNYILSAGVMFKGKFADVSSALIRAFARARPAPIATYYKGNRVIVVETMENENAY